MYLDTLYWLISADQATSVDGMDRQDFRLWPFLILSHHILEEMKNELKSKSSGGGFSLADTVAYDRSLKKSPNTKHRLSIPPQVLSSAASAVPSDSLWCGYFFSFRTSLMVYLIFCVKFFNEIKFAVIFFWK